MKMITKEIEIDLAHRVCFHNSKCRNLHGHRYKIEAGVDGEIHDTKYMSDFGMVVDYGDLKRVMLDYIDKPYDHGAIFYKEDPYKEKLLEIMALGDQDPGKLHFVDFMPTAENLCKHWYELIEGPLLGLHGVELKYVKVWETPTSSAIYSK